MKFLKEFYKKEWFILFLLMFVCSLFYLFKLGSYKLIDVDEPRYAEAAKEMLKSSNWITPYFNHELRFDKPIFFYWLIAISYLTFGITEFAARFPSAVMATLLVFFTYFLGKKTISKSYGLISSLILATGIEFITLARMSVTDMTLAFFICATIFSGFLNSFASESKRKYFWWLAYLFSAIAVLTKGPVGFVLPAIILGIYFILTGKLKDNLKIKYVMPGGIIFLLTSVPWYYLIIKEHGMLFINSFFLKHNLERFASSRFGQHQQPFYFYLIVIFIGFFPWSIYFISSLIEYSSRLYKYASDKQIKKFDLAIFKDADPKLKVILFNIISFLTIFIFFSCSKTKLATYILPLFPAMALLTGCMWHEFINENKYNKQIRISARIFAFICLIISCILLFTFTFILSGDIKLLIHYINYYLICLISLISSFLLVFLYKNQRIKAFAINILLMFCIAIISITGIIPIVYNSGQKDLISYVKYYKNIDLPDKKLLTYEFEKPSIVFYSDEKIDKITFDKINMVFNRNIPLFFILSNKELKKFPNSLKYNLISHGIKYSLISNFYK